MKNSVCSSVLMILAVAGISFAVPTNNNTLNTGKFWHVTDFHYDHTYWSSQLSCNAKVTNPSQFGDYWCDSPWKLVTSTLDAMKNLQSDVDFIIWTGDTVAHISDDNLNVDINMEILRNLTDAMRDAFNDTKVYPSYGNHDYYPSNQFPNLNNVIYNRTAVMWEQWIEDPDQMANFRKGGYYSRLVSPNLRVVALNTNLYYTSNNETGNFSDPSDQMQWLISVLQNARNTSEKVILTGHIPPGVHTPTRVVWFQEQFNKDFVTALRNFTDVVVGMHFGHDHHDGFKLFHDTKGDPAVPLFVAPSVTPWRYKIPSGMAGPAHNPSVRLVTYDRDTGRHLDIEQMFINLTQANLEGRANFTRLYSFTQHYNVPDITAASLEKLVTRMATDEGDKLLDDYFWFATVGADQGDRTCNKTCKSRFLCGFRHYDYRTFDACVGTLTATSSASGLLFAPAAVVVAVVMAVASFSV